MANILDKIYIKDVPIGLILDYMSYSKKDEDVTVIKNLEKAFTLFDKIQSKSPPKVYVKSSETDTVLGKNKNATIKYLTDRYYGKNNPILSNRTMYAKNLSDIGLLDAVEYSSLVTDESIDLYENFPRADLFVRYTSIKDDLVLSQAKDFVAMLRKSALASEKEITDDRQFCGAIADYAEFPSKVKYYRDKLISMSRDLRKSLQKSLQVDVSQERQFSVSVDPLPNIPEPPDWELSDYASTRLAIIISRYYDGTEKRTNDSNDLMDIISTSKYKNMIQNQCVAANDYAACESPVLFDNGIVQLEQIPTRVTKNNYDILMTVAKTRTEHARFLFSDFVILSERI